MEQLYEDPKDNAVATAFKNCDADGPLMAYISKMVRSLVGGDLDKVIFCLGVGSIAYTHRHKHTDTNTHTTGWGQTHS